MTARSGRGRPSPAQTGNHVAAVFAVAAPVVWLWYVLLERPHLVARSGGVAGVTVDGVPMLLMVVLVALGLAVPVGIILANRFRLRTLFRPTRGKVVTALVLAVVLPVAHLGPFPVALFLLPGASGLGPKLVILLRPVVVVLAAGVLFPLVAPAIAGVRHPVRRVAGIFCLWWGAYAVTFLLGAAILDPGAPF